MCSQPESEYAHVKGVLPQKSAYLEVEAGRLERVEANQGSVYVALWDGLLSAGHAGVSL